MSKKENSKKKKAATRRRQQQARIKKKVVESANVEKKVEEVKKKEKVSIIKTFRKATKEYDEMVKGDIDKPFTEINKDLDKELREFESEVVKSSESALSFFIILLAVLIIGCLVGITIYINKDNEQVKVSDIEVNCIASHIYQFNKPNTEDFECVIKGETYPLSKLPDGYSYQFVSDYYVEKEVGILINNHVYVAECPFVEAEDVTWESEHVNSGGTYSDAEWVDLNKNDLKGYIQYKDNDGKNDIKVELPIKKIEVMKESTGSKYLRITTEAGIDYIWTPEGGFE